MLARTYTILRSIDGTFLHIADEEAGEGSEEIALEAAGDEEVIREAEGVIRERYWGLQHFPGIRWHQLSADWWMATDNDLQS